jgi:hypothetical protein
MLQPLYGVCVAGQAVECSAVGVPLVVSVGDNVIWTVEIGRTVAVEYAGLGGKERGGIGWRGSGGDRDGSISRVVDARDDVVAHGGVAGQELVRGAERRVTLDSLARTHAWFKFGERGGVWVGEPSAEGLAGHGVDAGRVLELAVAAAVQIADLGRGGGLLWERDAEEGVAVRNEREILGLHGRRELGLRRSPLIASKHGK